MPWEDAQALHIYAPPRAPYGENWVEQILGEVVKPLTSRYGEALTWLWVTRYVVPCNEAQPPQGVPLPPEFFHPGYFRYVVFRLNASREVMAELHATTIKLAEEAGCFTEPRQWFPYDPVSDLGGNRFIRADAQGADRNERARLVALFIDATIRLMLHSLTRDSHGAWTIEPNMLPGENRHGSFFESVHHLFCNATGVPTTVLLGGEWTELRVTTWWMHEPVIVAGDTSTEFKVEVPIYY